MPEFSRILSTFKDRINVFYLSAFAPLLIFAFFHSGWLFSLIIPIFGFILLSTKKQDLLHYAQAKLTQKAFGLLIMCVSFFVSYALVPIIPSVTPYTTANYVIYLIGLCLAFFDVSALKEAASSIFLISAGSATTLISEWLEPSLSPYVTVQFAYLIQNIVNIIGIPATIIQSSNGSPLISFPTMQGGMMATLVNWYCVGVSSLLIFSIILIILLIEEHSNLKTRMLWAVLGIAGILILNVLRVVAILLADYFYGAEVGGNIHYVIGYTIFIGWLAVFLTIFSKKTGVTSE